MKQTSDRNLRRRKKSTEVSGLQIIEEAFQLLRATSGGTLRLYFFGTVPFACLFFYFWADMSRSSYANRDAGLVALGLALAFFWKCSWQARFCRSLWNSISPGYLPEKQGWQKFRYHAALWVFQAFAVPLVPVSACFVLPLGWMLAAFQNGYALALTQDYERKALRNLISHSLKNSHYQWAQNLVIWLTMGFIGLLAWANIYATCALPPIVAKTFFGIDSVFANNPAALSNSTFVFGTLLITWLILSPYLKAIFVLRCFYAEARTTGADLMSRLSELRTEQGKGENKMTAPVRKAAVLLAGGCFLLGGTVVAQDDSLIQQGTVSDSTGYNAGPDRVQSGIQQGTVVDSRALDVAITDTMAAKKYQWKFSRKIEEIEKDDELSWLQIQLRNLADATETRMRIWRLWIVEKIKDFLEKFKRDSRKPKKRSRDMKISDTTAQVLMNIGTGVITALVVGLVAWLLFVLIRYYRSVEKEEEEESEVVGDIDLESEEIVADQLPEDEWMKLARQQIEKGESRLAIRALFLATLANLGERGLLKIQKFKSNRDYRRELDLKARQEPILREAFGENTGLFERAWYGLHHIGQDSVDHFMRNYETITSETA
ncbi:MAG: DUF4129 domain-containing protein [Verrucomicrobiales bacterium]|nr:DUF4129 domain-containing protein [Verrucomicrobiales bacterium]